MSIDKIKKIELEITSNCNAACPGCARTQNFDILEIHSFGLSDLKRIFSDKEHIKDKKFKFCGVLGDPAFNPECVDMVQYITDNDGFCQLSTNGGIQSVSWWQRLGELSKNTKKVDVVFCVDGHKETNHIYRVNTVFDVIERNMSAYSKAGGDGTWMFIIFDHNEYELPTAEYHAKKLGFKFATRTGMRNSIHDWVSTIRKKQEGKLIKEEVIITTTGEKEHSKKDQIFELQQFISSYSKNNTLQMLTNENIKEKEIIDSIVCKFVHEDEIFIAADQTVWPCCFLWDSYFKNKENIREKLDEYGRDWNNLKLHKIDKIINHPWFDEILELSWSPKHNKHLTRCIRTCAKNKAYQNEIKFK